MGKVYRFIETMSFPKSAAVVYILLTVAVLNLIHLDPFWSSLLSAPAFFIIPALIGDILVSIVFNRATQNEALNLFVSWLTGTLILLVYGLVLTLLNVFSSQVFSASALLVSVSSIFIVRIRKDRLPISLNMFRRYFQFLLAIFCFLLPLFAFKFMTGFPGNYSLVGYRFTYISEAATQRNVLVLDQLTSYAPVFQIPMSIVARLYNADSYGLDWFVILIINILFFVGVYTFLRSTNLHESYCLLGAVVSSYVLVWNPSYLFPPLHDIQPRTLALVMFPYILASAIYALKKESNTMKQSLNIIVTFAVAITIFMMMRQTIHPELVDRAWIVVPTIIAVAYSFLLGALNRSGSPIAWFSVSLILCAFPLVHIFEGVYYVVLFTVFALMFVVLSRPSRMLRFFAYGFSSLGFISYFLIANGIVNVDPNFRLALPSWLAPEAPTEYSYLPKVYCEIFFNAISQAGLCLLILGIAIGIFAAARANKRVFVSSLITLCLILTLYLLPIPDIVRIGAALVPFMVYFIVYGIAEITNTLSRLTHRFVGSKILKRIPRIEIIYPVLILVAIIPSMILPFQTYVNAKMSILQGTGSSSQLSLVADYEYKMGLWIRANTPEDAVILSDPETMYIMAGISGRSIPISIGMLIEDLQVPDAVRLNWIRSNLFSMENSSEAAFYANLLGEDPYIVISGRTQKWLNGVEFVSEPYDFGSSTQFLSKFLNSEGPFKLLNSIDGKIYIFSLKQAYQKYQYNVFLVNDFSQYGNVTTFSNDWQNSTQYWYLEKEIISGEVTTITYDQYSSSGGDPSTIEWRIPIAKSYDWVDIFAYNLAPLNVDPGAFFSFSPDGKKWIVDNFSHPLKYVLSVIPSKDSFIFYGRGVPGKFSKLGTFVFVGFNSKS